MVDYNRLVDCCLLNVSSKTVHPLLSDMISIIHYSWYGNLYIDDIAIFIGYFIIKHFVNVTSGYYIATITIYLINETFNK